MIYKHDIAYLADNIKLVKKCVQTALCKNPADYNKLQNAFLILDSTVFTLLNKLDD